MPGFDGTGPQGFGPRTGGGRGACTGRTYGVGYGRGAGRGWNRTGPWYASDEHRGAAQAQNRDGALQLLKNRADSLEYELEEIKKRLDRITAD